MSIDRYPLAEFGELSEQLMLEYLSINENAAVRKQTQINAGSA